MRLRNNIVLNVPPTSPTPPDPDDIVVNVPPTPPLPQARELFSHHEEWGHYYGLTAAAWPIFIPLYGITIVVFIKIHYSIICLCEICEISHNNRTKLHIF